MTQTLKSTARTHQCTLPSLSRGLANRLQLFHSRLRTLLQHLRHLCNVSKPRRT